MFKSSPRNRRTRRLPILSRHTFSRPLALLLILLFASSFIPLGSNNNRLTFGRIVAAQNRAENDFELMFARKAGKLTKLVRRAALENNLARHGRTENDKQLGKLAGLAAIAPQENGAVSISLTVRLNDKSADELRAAGFAIGSQIGDVATVETTVARLTELTSLASVRKIETATYARPTNDLARKAIKLDDSNGNPLVAQDGTNVVVGMIDTGIDYRHLDFTVPNSNGKQTRIKYLLDMTVYNPKTINYNGDSITIDRDWDYKLPGGDIEIGRLYTQADINASLQKTAPVAQDADNVKQRDKNGHGTHVAAIAAGNGLASPSNRQYRGMAPNADLIVVKATRQDSDGASFRETDQINALKFIEQTATQLGKKFVINMSLGGHTGPHDGTTNSERAIDNIVKVGTGRAVCIAAGNEGDIDLHASGNLVQGSDIELKVDARDLFSTGDPTVSIDFFEFYYSLNDQFSLTITKPNGATLGPYRFGSELTNPDPTIDYIYNDEDGYINESRVFVPLDHDIFVTFTDEAVGAGSNWKFKIHADSVAADGHFNVWLGGGQFDDDANPQTPPPSYVDPSRRVSSPGTAKEAITVGAFVSRSQRYSIGSAATFTSQGPAADGRPKPEISAPGYYLFSALSADSTDSNADNPPPGGGPYIGYSGTSMSTPVVAGAVALIMQANPNLTGAQIKSLIENSADHDTFDPQGWSPRFGYGKLNVQQAIAAAIGGAGNSIDDTRSFVRRQYQDFLYREPDASGWDFWSGQISDCGGDVTCVDRKRVNTSGAYFLSTEFQATGYFVYRFYRGAFNRRPAFTEFVPDAQRVANGIIVNGLVSPKVIKSNKDGYVAAFLNRNDFKAIYDGLNNQQFVDKLIANTGEQVGAVDYNQLVDNLNRGADTRAGVLLKILDGTDLKTDGTIQFTNNYAQAFYQREFNPAFVTMQYFGYLTRDPDEGGFNFWLNKLNYYGNFTDAEMVKAFIVSPEYRRRFGLN